MREIGLYIHIPFCIKKCFYCDFNSIAFKNYHKIEKYLKALEKDISLTGAMAKDFVVKSVYLGGGTPSIIRSKAIESILRSICQQFSLTANPETTIEANPASVTVAKLKKYKESGINRISIGVQSFADKFLKILGRAHNSAQAGSTITMAKKSGFKKISIDLIYGLPSQTLKDWERELDCFLDAGVGHISFYDLKIEKGTPFYALKNKLELPDNDLQAIMYRHGCKKLEKFGYRHYEISSFALKGHESAHNQIYWRNDEYFGLGAGAYSYIKGRRFSKSSSITEYQQQLLSGDLRCYHVERLKEKARLRETIILNLRLLKGFSVASIEDRTGVKVDEKILDQLKRLKGQGLICSSGDRYRLSKKGILFYDDIASELVS